MSKDLFVFAGDLSGDLNCGLLVEELLRRHPDWQVRALGGSHLKKAGAEIVGDTSNLGVMGFAAVMATLPRQFAMKYLAMKSIAKNKPDLAILCDWGGFNMRVLPHLTAKNIPTLYYFPPRSWQKSGTGGLKVAALCDAIATPFPWSADRLNAAGGNAHWVGHPLLQTAVPTQSRAELRKELSVAEDEILVAILPGSRPLELKYIAPHVVDAITLVSRQLQIRWVVVAATGKAKAVRRYLGHCAEIYEGPAARVLAACDAAIVKSGTSTLEAAIAGAPQVVVYDVPPLIHLQGALTGIRRKIPLFALPNIILDREAVPELMAEKCRGPLIAQELMSLLQDEARVQTMRASYDQLREALGENLPYTAIQRTANFVEETLSSRS